MKAIITIIIVITMQTAWIPEPEVQVRELPKIEQL